MSESQIDIILKEENFEKFFEESLKLKPEDPEFVRQVKEVQRVDTEIAALAQYDAEAFNVDNTLKIVGSSIDGTLGIRIGSIVGRGRTHRTGSGTFHGNRLAPNVRGGTFKLWLTANTARLELFSNAGDRVDEFIGVGHQMGLDTSSNNPWEGTW